MLLIASFCTLFLHSALLSSLHTYTIHPSHTPTHTLTHSSPHFTVITSLPQLKGCEMSLLDCKFCLNVCCSDYCARFPPTPPKRAMLLHLPPLTSVATEEHSGIDPGLPGERQKEEWNSIEVQMSRGLLKEGVARDFDAGMVPYYLFSGFQKQKSLCFHCVSVSTQFQSSRPRI